MELTGKCFILGEKWRTFKFKSTDTPEEILRTILWKNGDLVDCNWPEDYKLKPWYKPNNVELHYNDGTSVVIPRAYELEDTFEDDREEWSSMESLEEEYSDD
jgi:hypothetical protein